MILKLHYKRESNSLSLPFPSAAGYQFIHGLLCWSVNHFVELRSQQLCAIFFPEEACLLIMQPTNRVQQITEAFSIKVFLSLSLSLDFSFYRPLIKLSFISILLA